MAKNRRTKRANGDGSVFQLPSGKWRACISLGTTADGKRLRRSRTAKSRADAVQFLRDMQAEGDRVVIRSSLTLMEFLDTWLLHVKATSAPGTHDSYSRAVENHISPLIGRTALADVRPATVRAMITELQARHLGSRTIENAFIVLRAALALAAKEGTIPANPCAKVNKPKHDPDEIFPFTEAESRVILDATEGHRLHALFVIAFSTGMRQGELFGLEWGDLDLAGGSVRIERQATDISGRVIVKPPKSESSRRRIELTPKCIAALEDRQRLRLKEGNAALPLVFPNRRHGHITRGVFRTRIWQPLLERVGVEYRGFHHVRHTYATLALRSGVPLPTVSQILGHAKKSTTLDIYSHVTPTDQKASTDAVSRLFG